MCPRLLELRQRRLLSCIYERARVIRRVRAGLREEIICWKDKGVCRQAATAADPALPCSRWRGGWFRVCWDVCSAASLGSLGKSLRSAFSSYKNLPWSLLPWGSVRWCWPTASTTQSQHCPAPCDAALHCPTRSSQHHTSLHNTRHIPAQHQAALPPHLWAALNCNVTTRAPLAILCGSPSLRWMSLNTCALL